MNSPARSTSKHVRMQINTRRLLSRLDDLAAIGALPGSGVQRLAFSEEDLAGRNWVQGHLEALGVEVRIDQVGNLFGILHPEPRFAGSGAVMFGSHTDTVGRAGRLDGSLGVVAALEALEVIVASDWRPARPLILASFVNEEGVRYMPDMMGSLYHAGDLDLATVYAARDRDGVSIQEELERLNYAGSGHLSDLVIDSFLELHIEQGPVLESNGADIGIVTGVQGLSWFEVTVDGASNHAGTTPMELRRDAGKHAAELTAQLRDLTGTMAGLRLTIGSMSWQPNLINVIPDRVVFTIDVRHPDPAGLEEAEARIQALLLAWHLPGKGLTVSSRPLARVAPCAFSERVVAAVSGAVEGASLMGHRMISGAGHDAHILSRCYEAGMIFIPSRGGVSHHPDEYSTDEQIVDGAQVLLHSVMTLADHPVSAT